jgi:hypothetical protein
VGDTVDFVQRIVIDPMVTSQKVPAPVHALLTALTPTHGAVGSSVVITARNLARL